MGPSLNYFQVSHVPCLLGQAWILEPVLFQENMVLVLVFNHLVLLDCESYEFKALSHLGAKGQGQSAPLAHAQHMKIF